MCDCNTDAGWMDVDFSNELYYHGHFRIFETNTTINCNGFITHMHAHESVCPTHTHKHNLNDIRVSVFMVQGTFLYDIWVSFLYLCWKVHGDIKGTLWQSVSICEIPKCKLDALFTLPSGRL
jgi:hypothetical protein